MLTIPTDFAETSLLNLPSRRRARVSPLRIPADSVETTPPTVAQKKRPHVSPLQSPDAITMSDYVEKLALLEKKVRYFFVW